MLWQGACNETNPAANQNVGARSYFAWTQLHPIKLDEIALFAPNRRGDGEMEIWPDPNTTAWLR